MRLEQALSELLVVVGLRLQALVDAALEELELGLDLVDFCTFGLDLRPDVLRIERQNFHRLE